MSRTLTTEARSKSSVAKNHKTATPFFGSMVQPKLSIGKSDDIYEREADAVADKVMRMPAPETFFSPQHIPVSLIQRKCAACEEEEKHVQTKAEPGFATATAPSSVDNALAAKGQPMDTNTRAFMESRFGYDFGAVRIHTDSIAAQSAKSINALAYTSGSSVVFGEGQYSPKSDSGKRLIAHELTHVIQQGGNAPIYQVQRQTATATQQLYNFSIGGITYDNQTIDQARGRLFGLVVDIGRSATYDEDRHKMQKEINADQRIVSSILEVFGGVDMPSLDIWKPARAELLRAHSAISMADFQRSFTLLSNANTLWQWAHKTLYYYLDSVISAGETTVAALEFTKKASAFVIKAYASEVGGFGGELIDRGYTALQDVAQQASEVHAGLRKKVDFKQIAIDAATPAETIAKACRVARMLGALPSQRGGAWNPEKSPGKRLDGPLKVYEQNPLIGNGVGKAKCRGACGVDCESCDPAIKDHKETVVKPDGTTEVWTYHDFHECTTHDGCRQHDAGFDWCKTTKNETSQYEPCHMLANLECACNHKPSMCVSWITGGPPADGKMYFADRVEMKHFGTEQHIQEVEPGSMQAKDEKNRRRGICYGVSLWEVVSGGRLVDAGGGRTPDKLREKACKERGEFGVTRDHFYYNLAVGEFICGGTSYLIHGFNRPGERIHSEDEMMTKAKKKFNKRPFKVKALFTERPPCKAICEINVVSYPRTDDFRVYYISENWQEIRNVFFGRNPTDKHPKQKN